jgi:hypothetical protein
MHSPSIQLCDNAGRAARRVCGEGLLRTLHRASPLHVQRH